MPIKMAEGSIAEGHEGAIPLGTLSHLKTNGNTIEALAAIWKKERPDDVEYLKKRYENKEPIDFSWELTYKESIADEDGESLTGVSMNAATIVGKPAYAGRTSAIALASANEGETMDTISLDQHNQEIEDLKKNYEDKLTTLQASLEETKEPLAELDELKKFKENADATKAKSERLESIKQKFTEANITVADEYFSSKAELLLSMSDEQVTFFIQEIVASLSKADDAQASISLTSRDIPPMHGGDGDKIETKDLVGFLKSLDTKGDN
jgi:vacuolar-type H+-ATPase subunit I/STV1